MLLKRAVMFYAFPHEFDMNLFNIRAGQGGCRDPAKFIGQASGVAGGVSSTEQWY